MLNGEEPAFEEFFAGYFPALYRFVLSRTGGDGTELWSRDFATGLVQFPRWIERNP